MGALPAAASAATITVNTTTDETASGDGLCSLREAIGAVDNPGNVGDCGPVAFGTNTIELGAHTYGLAINRAGPDDNSTGDLNVLASVTGLTVVGSGPGATVIDATGLGDRVLEIDSGAGVAVTGLTITGGHAPDGLPGTPGADATMSTNATTGGPGGAGQNGGGVENGGSLTLQAVAVTNNRAGSGGAGGAGGDGCACTTTLFGTAGGPGGSAGGGGGIYNSSTGTLALIDATISGNRGGAGGDGGNGGDAKLGGGASGGAGGDGSGYGDGGGVYNSGGTLTITDSTIDGKLAGNGGAGGLGGLGSTPAGNAGNGGNGGVAAWGGGVVSLGGSLSVINSTFAANHGGNGGDGGDGGSQFPGTPVGGSGGNGGNGGGGGDGGGLVTSGPGSIVSSTFAGNQVGLRGSGGAGGLVTPPATNGSAGGTALIPPAGGAMYLPSGSVSLQNTIVAASTGGNCAGPGSLTDGGHDLSFPDSSCPGTNGDPKLGSLGDDGGPTRTIGLLPGSAAIDQIPAGTACPATDQRGVSRPQPAGGKCDIGAYEFVAPTCQPVSAVTSAGRPVAVQLSCGDPAGASLTYVIDAGPGHGTLSGLAASTGKVTYTPTARFSGSDSFTYHATSPNGAALSQAVTIRVNRGQPPTITRVRLTHRRFRVTRRPTAISARKAPLGTTILFTLSSAAQLKIVITRSAPGLRDRHRCVAPSRKLMHAQAKPCKRIVIAGTLTRKNEPKGSDELTFSGRIGRRALTPGAYQATLEASNPSGSSRPVRLAFRIVR